MAANLRQATALEGAAIDGRALADFVVITDFEAGRFALVGHVLRVHADCAKWEESVVRADFRGTFDCDVRDQVAAFAHLHVWTDYAVRADLAGCGNFCAWINDCHGVNIHHWVMECGARPCKGHSVAWSSPPRPRELSISWQDTVASATFFPFTRAWPYILAAIMRAEGLHPVT